MLVARVAPPLPDCELPHQVLFHVPSGQRVVELVMPPGGLLVRRLAADLDGLGYEVAWIRPMPFEADAGSLAPLLFMALTRARSTFSGENEPIMVVESPSAAQAEVVLDQLMVPGVPEPFDPSVVLIVSSSQTYRRHHEMTRVRVNPPVPGSPRVRSFIPAQRRPREPGAPALALVERLLETAPAAQLAALEMAGHLGYAHSRLGSLELAVAGPTPWWVPLTGGWWQVDPAWRPALVAGAAGAARVARLACLSKLVAELAEDGAVHEGIELCLNAGWPGLAADLLAGEAESLLSSGRQVALTCWLARLPAGEIRSHPGLSRAAADLMRTGARPGTSAGDIAARNGLPVPASPAPQKKHWFFYRSHHDIAAIDRASGMPAGSSGGSADGHGEIDAGQQSGGQQAQGAAVRAQARLLGQFEFVVEGEPVQHWRGKRGRMVLAFLLLHRAKPLTRDELGGAFWPDAEPEVVRNRLHVALHGLRKDLRRICQDPIVVHSQRGFSLNPGIDLWLDVEGFDEALRLAKKEQADNQEAALKSYEAALQLYRGELLEDAPFEEWALVRREQIRLQHLDALDQLARLRFAAGQYADCLDTCQHLIPGDLCREDIHRLMMRCYTRLNQPHLALHQYHQCERLLNDELGMEPAAATRHLYEQIKRREII